MSNNRNEVRLEKKLLVNISKDGFESMGLTSNISKNGLFVTTTEALPLPVESEVSILIGAADETFTLKGKIMWSKEGADESTGEPGVATGIQITEATPQYLEFVEKMLADGANG